MTTTDRWRKDGRLLASSLLGLGTIASIGLVASTWRIGSIVRPGADTWWFAGPRLGGSTAHVGAYLSIALLLVAWAGLGLLARRGRLGLGAAVSGLVLWGLPLYLGQPLFSRDLYSYVAQGIIARRGLNPYEVAPSLLDPSSIFSSIATVWHHTTSPYGPGFVGLSRLAVLGAGDGIVAQLLAFRTLALAGVALGTASLALLARDRGVDPGLGIWLAMLSPLALFGYVASAHNDALMVGLLLAGLLLARRGRLLLGVAVIALAASVKLPALLAIAFLFVEAATGRASVRERLRLLAGLAATAVAVLVGTTLLVGDGFAWAGPKALAIPTRLHVLITPTVAIGSFLGHLLHLLGLPVGTGTSSVCVSVVIVLAELATLAGIAYLLVQVPRGDALRLLGAALLLLVLGSPTMWPWYLLWGLAVLAATALQRSLALAVVAGGAMLLVGVGGSPMLGPGSVWITGPLLLLGLVAFLRKGRWRRFCGLDALDPAAAPAKVEQ